MLAKRMEATSSYFITGRDFERVWEHIWLLVRNTNGELGGEIFVGYLLKVNSITFVGT